MRITTKGQVTIPQRLRLKFGLLPHTDVRFEEAEGGVLVRPVQSKRALVAERLLVDTSIPLLTRDVGRYHTCFPAVKLVSPPESS